MTSHWFNLVKIVREWPAGHWMIKLTHPDWRALELRPNHTKRVMDVLLVDLDTHVDVHIDGQFEEALQRHLQVLRQMYGVAKFPYTNLNIEHPILDTCRC